MFTHLPKLLLAAALLIAPACVDPEGEGDFVVESGSQEAIGWNAIGWNAIGWNSLMTYPTVLTILKDKPLSTETYTTDPSGEARVLRSRLLDEDTKLFMHYLVGCALKPGDSVAWRLDTESETFDGALGLCPSWRSGGIATDTACQERLSACLMMRNNAFGVPVMFSARGNGPDERPLKTANPLTGDGKDLPSLHACTRSTRGNTDCGWDPGYVGVCQPGANIRLGVKKAPRTWQMIRVCSTPHSCDAAGGNLIKYKTVSPYAASRPSVGFKCPASGHFTVMSRAYYSTQRTGLAFNLRSGNASYPASEMQVFWWREGAFYGNMFERVGVRTWLQFTSRQPLTVKKWYWTPQSGWTDRLPTTSYVVYPDMYACQSPEWTTERARNEQRVCAAWSEETQCAAVPTGNCSSTKAYPDQNWVTTQEGRCSVEDSRNFLGDGDYDNCVDPSGKVWRNPLTSYLKDRCDGANPQFADCALQ